MVGKVAERILRAIASGAWPAGGPLPAVRQLAADLGVSRDTVGAALQRLAEGGLIETHPRLPAQLRPDAAEQARQLLAPTPAAPQSPQVAILMSDQYRPLTKNQFYFKLVSHLVSEAEKRGLRTAMVWWPMREQLAVVESLPRTGYDAAIFIGVRAEYMASLFFMHERKFPLLIYNSEIPGVELPTVIEDLYGAVQRVADSLFKSGHRNVCLVAKALSDVEQVLVHRGLGRGWMDYLAAAGLIEKCTMPVYVPWEHGKGPYDEGFWRILHSPERPTAMVFAHSFWAQRLVEHELKVLGLKVPEELSLVTFDETVNIPVTSSYPLLSNVDINYARTAQCIVETVRKMLAGDPHPPIIRVRMDFNITESIGPAP
jgi:DNA-binding LacI/PurR family transcriptional regulator